MITDVPFHTLQMFFVLAANSFTKTMHVFQLPQRLSFLELARGFDEVVIVGGFYRRVQQENV